MNRKISVSRKAFVCALAAFISCVIVNMMSAPVSATSASEVMQKALINDMDYCYRGAALMSPLSEAGSMNFAFDLSALLKPGGAFYLPTNIGNSVGTSAVSCKDVFLGKGSSMQSVYAAFGKSKPNTAEQMGYVASSESGDSDPMRCVYLKYNLRHKTSSGSETVERNLESNSLCFFVESDGDTIKTVDANSVKSFDRDKQRTDLTGNIILTANNACIYYNATGVKYNECIVNGGRGFGGTSFSNLLSTFNSNASLINAHEDYGGVAGNMFATTVGGNTEASAVEDTDHQNGSTAASLVIKSGVSNPIAVQNITGGVIGDYKFNDSDWYFMYRTYIDSLLSDSVTPISVSNDCSPENSSLTYAITYDGTNWCSINGGENVTKQFAVRQDDVTLKLANFSEVIRKMKLLNFSNVSSDLLSGTPGDPMNGGENDPSSTNPGGTDGDAGLLDGCFSNAGVLGWILCPVLKIAGAATEGIYEMIVENYLSMKSSAMTSTGLRESWGKFQGYANILFAILLVVVILSQVTGIGLSNYGIKKVLPRLIITIVLVNLSYILCLVAVDLSNIIGTSLNDLLGNMDVGGFVASDLNPGTMVANSIEGLAATAATIAIGSRVIPIAAEAWPNLILVLFLAVISVLISILFFFILLAVRQAVIIVLVAIAPLAVVCYALPNTQKMFDRWLKMFSAMLMVFPICGAVMGGCNFASRLLLDAGGENGLLYYIIIMVLGVVPLFFIPSILKSSMSALGSIGARLATSGERFSRWANRAVVGSQAFQDRRQEAQRNVGLARNKRIMDGTRLNDAEKARLKDLRERRASLTGAERRELKGLSSREFRYARASSARERALREEQQAGVIANRGEYDYGTDRYMAGQEGFEVAQRLSDVKDHKALYESGQVSGVDVDNISSLETEHAKLLADSIANPENKDTRAKLEAVQELLGEKKEDGLEAIHRNLQALAGDTSSNAGANLQSKGLKNAVRHLRGKFAGDIKGGNRAMDRLMTKIQNNDMDAIRAKAVGIKQSGDTRNLSDIIADEIAAESMSGYSANNLNDMHDAAIDRYIDMAENGHMEAAQVRNFAKLLNEAIASGTINLKGKVGVKAQKFLESAYAADAVANTSANAGVTTTGSSVFEHASLESLQNLSTGIRNGSINGALATNIVENARRYMESGALVEPERAAELRQIIAAAQQHGITSLAGATDRFDYNEAAFKVRGAPEKLNSANLPKNWEQVRSNPLDPNSAMKWVEVTARDGSGRPTATRDLDEKELAHIRAVSRTNRERERENARRGFDPTPPSP